MRKDYYMVLGISKNADLSKIKKAYRKIVKDFHPDIAISANCEKFREITEAYETLIDDEKRKQHDMKLNRSQTPVTHAHPTEFVRNHTPFIDEFFSLFSPVDDFFGGFLPGFFDRGRKVRTLEKDLYVEVILSREEALAGGLLPITVPVLEPCPHCGGSGIKEGFICAACSGKGRVRTERQFSLTIPPRIDHGTQVRISLEDIGLKNTDLHITVLIDPTLDFF